MKLGLRRTLAGLLAGVLLALWPAPSFGPADARAQALDGTAPAAPAAEPAAPPQRTILRFLTDSDYPPFNYFDEEGTLTGFNVDFARAVCLELDTGCDIQTAEWKSLLPSLERGETDAVIASIGVTPATLAQADFTSHYYVMSASFVARKDAAKLDVTPVGLEGKKIGVIKGSAHEAYLLAFFPDTLAQPFETDEQLREALTKSEIDLIFGDRVSLMFWINGAGGSGCCEFRSGPYLDPRYFGDGIGIAVRKGDAELRQLLEKGIQRVRRSARYEELLLRYFPQRLF
jgi:polar amino acid transport system substrate-binding protein